MDIEATTNPNAKEPSDSSLSKYRKSRSLSLDINAMGSSTNQTTTSTSNSKWSILVTILDFSLFSNPIFLLLGLERFLVDLAFFFNYQFAPSLMVKNGLSPVDASIVTSAVGVSNMIGRLSVGFFMDHPKLGVFLCLKICYFMMAVCLVLYPFGNSLAWFLVVSCAYGYASAIYIVSAASLYVKLFGVESLTSTFGFLTFFRGCGDLIGPVIVGCLYDLHQSFFIPASFCCGTVAVALAVLILVHRRHKNIC